MWCTSLQPADDVAVLLIHCLLANDRVSCFQVSSVAFKIVAIMFIVRLSREGRT